MSKFDGVELVYGQPMYMMAKPVGAACNLRCSYCYYAEKRELYDSPSQLMSDDTLELFIREYIESQTIPILCDVWWRLPTHNI